MSSLPSICMDTTLLVEYSLYCAFGSFTILTSLIVFISIIKSSELRRKLVLTCLLAAYDHLVGWGYFTAGVHRMTIVTDTIACKQTNSGLQCILRPYVWLFLWHDQIQCIIMMCIAGIKFWAVFRPFNFNTVNTYKIRKIIVALICLYSVAFLAIFGSLVRQSPQQTTADCVLQTFTPIKYVFGIFICQFRSIAIIVPP